MKIKVKKQTWVTTKDTCYEVLGEDSEAFWIIDDLGKESGIPKEYCEVVKENEEMKELTFREVIANIKEGEVWESEYKKIYCNEAGIMIEEKSDTNSNDMYFANARIYKLVRQEYSFQEAFEAFENGEEIESIESKWRWKKDGLICLSTPYGGQSFETSCDRIFSIDEIKGKWYINK